MTLQVFDDAVSVWFGGRESGEMREGQKKTISVFHCICLEENIVFIIRSQPY